MAKRIPRQTPVRLTSMTSFQASSLISPAAPPMATPALFTMTSRRP
jgi:hypothetical protein